MTCLHLVRSHVTTSHPSIDCTLFLLFFFFNDTATTEIYTLSLHDALPILRHDARERQSPEPGAEQRDRERSHGAGEQETEDRKSTRLNSSHLVISYAVFCLKKKIGGQPKDHTILIVLTNEDGMLDEDDIHD